MAPLSTYSRSAEAADPPEYVFRSDRPLAAAAPLIGSRQDDECGAREATYCTAIGSWPHPVIEMRSRP